ncbi:MAG TPA: LysR family transcriptional regulator [Sphingomonas sp.]|jgi:DNA-binding transcriptional LysR family regulator
MNIRQVAYFVALAREQHFARAAAACNVSQPTLSAGLLALEDQVGRRLIERDRRFIGLTAEGHAVLPWAQQLVAALDGLTAAADAVRGPLSGTLRLGAIPASMPATGAFAATLRHVFPDVELSVRSLTSREIARRLSAFELDAGLTYTEHEPPSRMIGIPLYIERAMFVTSQDYPQPPAGPIAWSAALEHPLCLLHQDMQNRRILDEHLARQGLSARPWVTADSYVTLLAMAQSGAFAAIAPDSYAPLLPGWARMLPFDEPASLSRIGLIVADQSPLSPMAVAALTIANQLAAQPPVAPA